MLIIQYHRLLFSPLSPSPACLLLQTHTGQPTTTATSNQPHQPTTSKLHHTDTKPTRLQLQLITHQLIQNTRPHLRHTTLNTTTTTPSRLTLSLVTLLQLQCMLHQHHNTTQSQLTQPLSQHTQLQLQLTVDTWKSTRHKHVDYQSYN